MDREEFIRQAIVELTKIRKEEEKVRNHNETQRPSNIDVNDVVHIYEQLQFDFPQFHQSQQPQMESFLQALLETTSHQQYEGRSRCKLESNAVFQYPITNIMVRGILYLVNRPGSIQKDEMNEIYSRMAGILLIKYLHSFLKMDRISLSNALKHYSSSLSAVNIVSIANDMIQEPMPEENAIEVDDIGKDLYALEEDPDDFIYLDDVGQLNIGNIIGESKNISDEGDGLFVIPLDDLEERISSICSHISYSAVSALSVRDWNQLSLSEDLIDIAVMLHKRRMNEACTQPSQKLCATEVVLQPLQNHWSLFIFILRDRILQHPSTIHEIFPLIADFRQVKAHELEDVVEENFEHILFDIVSALTGSKLILLHLDARTYMWKYCHDSLQQMSNHVERLCDRLLHPLTVDYEFSDTIVSKLTVLVYICQFYIRQSPTIAPTGSSMDSLGDTAILRSLVSLFTPKMRSFLTSKYQLTSAILQLLGNIAIWSRPQAQYLSRIPILTMEISSHNFSSNFTKEVMMIQLAFCIHDDRNNSLEDGRLEKCLNLFQDVVQSQGDCVGLTEAEKQCEVIWILDSLVLCKSTILQQWAGFNRLILELIKMHDTIVKSMGKTNDGLPVEEQDNDIEIQKKIRGKRNRVHRCLKLLIDGHTTCGSSDTSAKLD